MISKTTCDNCGTPLIPGARFCRQCGRLLADPSNSSSVTEATTRVFDAPAADAPAFTRHVDARPTGPAYLAPGEAQFVQAPATAGLPKKSGAGKIVLISFGVIVLFITVVSIAVVAALWNRRPAPGPGIAVPGMPPMPPPPDVGPPPGAPAAAAPSVGELAYPGAETVMNMTRGGGGGVLQLRTGDAFDDVLNWYSARLSSAKTIKTPGGATAVLKTDKTTVVIAGAGGQTNITVKHDAP